MSLINRGTIAATVLVTLSPDLSGNFVATGAADQVEINAAIVYCAAIGGGEVAIGHGDWTLAATVNVPASVLLRGMGWTTILNYDAGGNCITFTGDNAKLRDLKIIIVAGAGGAGTRPNGIIADTRTNLEISGVWIIGDLTVGYDTSQVRQCGIVIDTVTGSTIQNNFIFECRQHGISGTAASNNLIVDNECSSIQNDGMYLISSSNDNTITDNNIHDNTKSGIELKTDVEGNVITGNHCEANGDHGVLVSTAAINNTVTGNTCTKNRVNGIRIFSASYNTITGNTCDENEDNGIELWGPATNNTIVGNSFNLNQFNGIRLDDASNNTVVGNTCTGNDSGDTNTYSGINITDTSSDNIIHSNTCNDNDKYGIDIDDPLALRNWVKNNQLRGNGAGAFNDGGTGTKTPFINIVAPNPDAFIGTHAVQQMADDIDSIIRFEVPIPREYQETVTAEVLIVAGGTGDLRRAVATNWGQFGTAENYDVGTDSIAAGQVAVLVDDMTALDIAAAFTGITSEDWIGVEFTRGASNVLDTVGAAVYFIGFRMRYV